VDTLKAVVFALSLVGGIICTILSIIWLVSLGKLEALFIPAALFFWLVMVITMLDTMA